MKKAYLLFVAIVISVCTSAQNGKNLIKPIDKDGFEVDSILSMRGDVIVYLRAGTEFDIKKSEVAYVNHSILGRIDISEMDLPIPEPRHIGEAYMCNFDNKEYVQLEKTVGVVKIKDQFLGPEKKIYVSPERSPLRVKIGEQKIILHVPNQDEDPNAIIKVAKFSVEKTRKLSVARINEITGTVSFGIQDYQTIPFKAQKYGSSSILITVDLTESGEYCIMLNTPNNIGDRVALACFGV